MSLAKADWKLDSVNVSPVIDADLNRTHEKDQCLIPYQGAINCKLGRGKWRNTKVDVSVSKHRHNQAGEKEFAGLRLFK